jgi:hypothetical protein
MYYPTSRSSQGDVCKCGDEDDNASTSNSINVDDCSQPSGALRGNYKPTPLTLPFLLVQILILAACISAVVYLDLSMPNSDHTHTLPSSAKRGPKTINTLHVPGGIAPTKSPTTALWNPEARAVTTELYGRRFTGFQIIPAPGSRIRRLIEATTRSRASPKPSLLAGPQFPKQPT